ncbi:MAG: PP2C family protein-serine/threonine phosphatase [Acidimicrobiales bacterium]
MTDRLVAQLDELTDALVTANDQLVALHQLNAQTAGSLEPDVATERALRQAMDMIEASAVTFHRSETGATEPTGPASVTVGQRARSAGSIPLEPFEKPWIDRRAADGSSRLVAPVRAGVSTFGTIVAEGGTERHFTTGDLKLLDAVANHLALVLELADLHADAMAQALVQRDHDTASTLAQAALGVQLPTCDGVDVAAIAKPARSAGGDFFAAGPTQTGLYVALGDVSGKGLPAALVMTNAMWAVRAAFDRHPPGDVGSVLDDVDRQLSDYLADMAMFITMAVAHVDVAAGELTITNAGQSPVLVGDDHHGVALPTNGPPIGILEPRRHVATRQPFGSGALLFIGSDGCTDQRSPDGEMLGEEVIADIITAPNARSHTPPSSPATASDRRASDIVDAVAAVVAEHRSGADQDDDVTAIVVRCPGRELADS